MNELIERLAREALDLAEFSLSPRVFAGEDKQIEAFAKLVARECSEIARTTENPFSVSRVIRERFEL